MREREKRREVVNERMRGVFMKRKRTERVATREIADEMQLKAKERLIATLSNTTIRHPTDTPQTPRGHYPYG